MIRRLLVANRGEIALRVLRSARELGIEVVAVFSEADREARHVRLADRAVCIGPPPAQDSYLNARSLVAAALGTGCDALHPGYGFLAEDAGLAELCAEQGITFVGPTPEAIRLMGDKQAARATMAAAGVPVVPGGDGVIEDVEAVREVAAATGFPLLLKARAGGGGRGLRLVEDPSALEDAFLAARAEAQAAFADGSLYVERLLAPVRHIEVQVLADAAGRVIHLGERECSVQRRHQKLVEEAPSPAVSAGLREQLGAIAVRAAAAVGYRGAGTLEFLYAVEGGGCHFIEMNTRIQVEHPITELVTGVDLVAWQLRIAGGEALDLDQGDIQLRGHAIECRVNAEDPDRGFAPSPGTLTRFVPPGGPGVRVDTHCHAGAVIGPHYDSLIAKLAVHADDRPAALARARRALDEFEVAGAATTIPALRRVLDDPGFQAGRYTTTLLADLDADRS